MTFEKAFVTWEYCELSVKTYAVTWEYKGPAGGTTRVYSTRHMDLQELRDPFVYILTVQTAYFECTSS